jgi:hypothetical protein
MIHRRGDEMENLTPDERGLDRGARLFAYLVDAANSGDALGIAYSDFIAYLHGAASFRELAGRSYMPGDTADVLCAAEAVTARAGGRKRVGRAGRTIDAGMDTFIWSSKPPFDRPEAAWCGSRFGIPYSRADWLLVFPREARHLVVITQLELKIASPDSASSGARTPTPRVPLSGSQLSGFRTRLVRFLESLDSQKQQSSPAARIARLRNEDVIPRYVSPFMLTITEMRNAWEYKSKTLSLAESTAVEAAWAAIEEWARGRGLKI